VSSSSSGGTTRPSASTGGAGAAGGSIAIQWVFPVPRTTPLVDQVVFGRDASATERLPGDEASRRHAEVRRVGPLPALRDLESRNGTWVNGQRIAESPVGPGDVVRIGEWVGVVRELSEDGSSLELRDLGSRWYGGATLARAAEPGRRVATTDLPVIVQGETGVGKEGMAQAIHQWSGRPGPFVAVNCGAIPAAMAEGELFGYRKGAFTGADRASLGFFRAADGGTLLLDEVLELSPAVQTKLLRVLEQREVLPLGETRPVPVNARIVCATQEPLSRAVAERRFRADLLARLDGLTVVLPPLRTRREDIAPLFLLLCAAQMGGQPPRLDPKLVETLLLYDWPLNVRELVLLVRRLAAVHGNESTLKRSMLPERMRGDVSAASAPRQPSTPARASTSDSVAFDQLVQALREHGGNITRAAAALSISRSRAYRLLEARPEFDRRSIRDDDGPS
jgi:transcriptional regulator of acetoin/glycerol metabolism